MGGDFDDVQFDDGEVMHNTHTHTHTQCIQTQKALACLATDYSYTYGNTCLDGYLPITTSADDCSLAAEYLGLSTGRVAHAANNPCKVGDGIICRLDYDPTKHTEL